MKKKICIKFETSIVHLGNNKELKDAKLYANADSALEALIKKGWTVIINTKHDVGAVRDFLDEHKIKYDYINEHVENADLYVDTDNIRFKGDWKSTIWDIGYWEGECKSPVDTTDEMVKTLNEADIWKRGEEKRIKAIR